MDRAERLARRLFADDVHEGDCRSMWGREGQPCLACADMNRRWAERIAEVREALAMDEADFPPADASKPTGGPC